MKMEPELVNINEVFDILDSLKVHDIKQSGGETLETFDSDRAKNALLNHLSFYEDYIQPVRCDKCIHRTEHFHSDVNLKGKGLISYGCDKYIGKYLGDNGYCSEGERI